MILPLKCSGSHCRSVSSFLNLLDEAQRCDSWEYCLLELRRHSIDSIHLYCFPNYHWIRIFQCAKGSSPIFPTQSTESEKTWVVASVNQQTFSHNKLVCIHVASWKSVVLIPVISFWSLISFLVSRNNCPVLFQRLFFTCRKFTSWSCPRWTAARREAFRNIPQNSHIHKQIIHRVIVFSSVDLPDDQEYCFQMMNCGWRHAQIVWPFCLFSFWSSLAGWLTGSRSCFISNRLLCSIFFTPSFRFGKIHIPWFLFCSDRFPRGCVHQPAKVCIFQSRLRTRRCVGFWVFFSSCYRVSREPWVSPDFWAQSDFSRMRDLSEHEKTGSSLWISILPHIFLLLLLLHHFRHRVGAAYQVGLLAQQVEMKWLMLNKWRRLFHSSRVKFPLVTMSASWCLVSMYFIGILGSRLILSNNQSRATLWVLDICLIVGLRPFDYHHNLVFVILKDIQQ